MGERHPVRRSNPSCATLTIFRQRTTTATERRETTPPESTGATPIFPHCLWPRSPVALARTCGCPSDSRTDPGHRAIVRQRVPTPATIKPDFGRVHHIPSASAAVAVTRDPDSDLAERQCGPETPVTAAAPGPQYRWPRPPAGTTVSPGRERRARAGASGNREQGCREIALVYDLS